MEYVTNKDKTVRPRSDSASSLQEAVDYAHNREKTECDVFESAIGCTLETAFEDMLDRYVEQMHFLSLHGIDSRAQLEEYRKPLLDEIAALAKERRRLYRSEPESPRIGQLTARLQALRKENRLCGTIEQHSVEIDQRLAEAKAKRQRYMENENKKGVDRTERRQDTRQRDG